MDITLITSPLSWVFQSTWLGPLTDSYSQVILAENMPIIYSGTITQSNQWVNKLYVDTAITEALPNVQAPDLASYVKKDGSVNMTTNIILNTPTPALADEAVHKLYVDSFPVTGNVASGTIVKKATITAPSNWLRCNGAVLLQASYPALYAVIGTTFNTVTATGDIGQPWSRQPVINTTQTTDVSTWSAATVLPGDIALTAIAITKNRIYTLGGLTAAGGVALNTVYTAPIDSNGIIGTWTLGTPLPGITCNALSLVTKSRLYVISGSSASVWYAPINNDGTIGGWVTDTSLAVSMSTPNLVVTNNRVYVISGAVINTVYTAPIDTNGIIGTWVTGTAFPVILSYGCVIQTYNRVYICGGLVNNATPSATVYTAPINSDGTIGTWATGTALPGTTYTSMYFNTKNRAWIVSGNYNGVGALNTITAPINTNGTLGAWSAGVSIGGVIQHGKIAITSSRVYTIGCYSGTVAYYATFTGGSNDYITGISILGADSTLQFTLPDTTTLDAATPGLYSYIKI